MIANHGDRPSGLGDKDIVRVRLNNGHLHEWTVGREGQGISWRLVPPDDPCWPFRIAEWESV